MKVLMDVHLPFRLASFLKTNGIEALHVNELPDSFYSTDKAIAAYADTNGFTVLTKDIDFRNSFFLHRTPRKLIRICLGNISTKELIEIFENKLELLVKANSRLAIYYIEISRENALILNS